MVPGNDKFWNVAPERVAKGELSLRGMILSRSRNWKAGGLMGHPQGMDGFLHKGRNTHHRAEKQVNCSLHPKLSAILSALPQLQAGVEVEGNNG